MISKFLKKITYQANRLVNYLENLDKPFSYFILTFVFIIALRTLLELFAYNYFLVARHTLAYYLWFIVLAISVILIAYLATKESILKISKVVLSGFCLLVIPPLVDFFLTCMGEKAVLTYLWPETHKNLALLFLTFGGPLTESGMTLGLRVELILALLAAFIYFYIKNNHIFKSLFFTFLIYTVVFFLIATPFILENVPLLLRGIFKIDHTALRTYYFLFLITVLAIPLFYLAHNRLFKLIWRNLRFSRVLHYELMFLLGVVLSLRTPLAKIPGLPENIFVLTENNLAFLIFTPFIILCSFTFAVIINDIEDYQIDLISNKERPLIKRSVSLATYRKISWAFFAIALTYSLIINFRLFFIALLMMGIYFLYSAPPLRFKRVPIFSKLAISFNSLILVILGLMAMKRLIIPQPDVIIFFLSFTLSANFIDLKDYAGDKEAGIKTLPTIVGLKKAKLYIGLFFILNYLLLTRFVKEWYFAVPFALLGLFQFYLINRKNYQEKYVLYFYLLTVSSFIIYLIP